jgi:hypothetical protein
VLHAPSSDSKVTCSDMLSLVDYPCINYWKKGDWLKFRTKEKNSSALGSKASPRGGTRCVQGTNILMIYLEDMNREPIDGCLAANIHKFARKIWACFHNEGRAPAKWSNADKKVED